MTYIRVAESSAGSAVGTNLMTGEEDEIKPFPRFLQGVALTGSAAAGDAAVDIYIGDTVVAKNVPNARTGGVVVAQDDIVPVNRPIPPGSKLRVLVSDSGSTNVLYAHLFISP